MENGPLMSMHWIKKLDVRSGSNCKYIYIDCIEEKSYIVNALLCRLDLITLIINVKLIWPWQYFLFSMEIYILFWSYMIAQLKY